jgi:hypothetical protein
VTGKKRWVYASVKSKVKSVHSNETIVCCVGNALGVEGVRNLG